MISEVLKVNTLSLIHHSGFEASHYSNCSGGTGEMLMQLSAVRLRHSEGRQAVRPKFEDCAA
jgi:hypothetical protein